MSTTAQPRLALVVAALWAVSACVAYVIVTSSEGAIEDEMSRGFFRMSMSMFSWPSLIVGGLIALLSGRAWYDQYRQGENAVVPVIALLLCLVGIVFVLLI